MLEPPDPLPADKHPVGVPEHRGRRYAFEFLSIFVAVISAFALNNWNDHRKDEIAEAKILNEIYRGLGEDLKDIDVNVAGHRQGIRACTYWRSVLLNEPVDVDSAGLMYFFLLRSFLSMQNTSGYETLKSRGLELIQDDSLRAAIITTYEYDYYFIRSYEEQYGEMQFYQLYHEDFDRWLASHFTYDEALTIVGLDLPLKLSAEQKSIAVSYLNRIAINRQFAQELSEDAKTGIARLREQISQSVTLE